MSTTVRLLCQRGIIPLEVADKATVQDVIHQMEQRVPAATQFANTPLPAPILVHKGAQLKNEQMLSELALAPSDYLTFLYPLVDPEPTRTKVVGQYKRQSAMAVDPSPLNSTLASTLDGVLASITGRPAVPSMSSGDNAAALQQLKDMGFPEGRCRKALLLNEMNFEAAFEWILAHMEDADVDEPLSDEQLRLVDNSMRSRAQKQQQETAEKKKRTQREELAECVQANTCTYAVTGPHMVPTNEYYNCYTCGLDGGKGCCTACVAICHAGHVVHRESFPADGGREGQFFCDCPEHGTCKCCPPEAMPKKH